MDIEQLAKYIKLHAERAGMTQMDLVRETGLSKDTINRIFNARPGAGEGVLQKIADCLGIVIPNNIIPSQLLKENNKEENNND